MDEEKGLTLELPGGEEIYFYDKELVIGREDFIGIIPDEELKYITRKSNPDDPEKKQFEIVFEDGEYYIIDENSHNNTALNNKNIRGKGMIQLEDEDEIKVPGGTTINVRIF